MLPFAEASTLDEDYSDDIYRRLAAGEGALKSTVYHEAGHAVAGLLLRLPLTELVIEGSAGHVRFLREAPCAMDYPRYLRRHALVSLAGPAAEYLYCERNGAPRAFAGRWAGDEGGVLANKTVMGVFRGNIRATIERRRPGASPDELVAAQRMLDDYHLDVEDLWRQACRLVARSEVWCRIEGLSRAVMRRNPPYIRLDRRDLTRAIRVSRR